MSEEDDRLVEQRRETANREAEVRDLLRKAKAKLISDDIEARRERRDNER